MNEAAQLGWFGTKKLGKMVGCVNTIDMCDDGRGLKK
jgi:hypothetical protein